MDLILDTSVEDFLAKSRFFLEENEARDHLILGQCLELQEGSNRNTAGSFLTLVQERGVQAVGIHVSRKPLLISFEDTGPAELFAHRLHKAGAELTAVHGPARGVQAFAENWTRISQQKNALISELKLLKISKVRGVKSPRGRLRVARETDLPRIVDWLTHFYAEVHPHETRADKEIKEQVRRKHLLREVFVLEHEGETIACAETDLPTPHGIRISSVYLPPEKRGKGYGSTMIASLAQQILISGKRHCFLHVDIKSPFSRHLYESLGFEPVSDTRIYLFQPG